MKCKRKLWTAGLELLKHAVDLKSTMPALATCRVEAVAGKVALTACDINSEIRVQFPCDGHMPPMSFTWKTLLALSKAVKGRDGMIEFGSADAVAERNDAAILRIGKRSFKIDASDVSPPRSFDKELSGKNAVEAFDADHLLRALKFVLLAVSNDATRFHLNTPCFIGDGRLAATDGHRMHVVDKVGGFMVGTKPLPIQPISGHALVAAIKATGAVHVMARAWVSSRIVEYSLEGTFMDVYIRERSFQGSFPPIDQVTPNHTESYEIDRQQLAESLQTIVKVLKANGDVPAQGVKLLVNGELKIGADGISEVLSLARTAPREQAVGAHPSYLLDAIAGDGELVEIFYGEALEPLRIVAGDDLVAVVMPTRID